MTLKEIKRKHNLKDKDIAEMLGYKNAQSYTQSKARKRVDSGLEKFYARIVADLN